MSEDARSETEGRSWQVSKRQWLLALALVGVGCGFLAMAGDLTNLRQSEAGCACLSAALFGAALGVLGKRPFLGAALGAVVAIVLILVGGVFNPYED